MRRQAPSVCLPPFLYFSFGASPIVCLLLAYIIPPSAIKLTLTREAIQSNHP